MSYNNFIPTVWSADLLKERERACVAVSLCNKDYEGDIKDVGDRVKILGVGRPTISKYVKNSTVITPEQLQDQSTMLEITEADMFAFLIDDIDKRQAKGDLKNAEMKEAAQAMAESADNFVYGKYGDAGTTITASSITSADVLSTMTSALKALWSFNVPKTEEIYFEVSPAFMEKLVLAKILYGQPNENTIQNGYVGNLPMLGAKVYLTNGIYNDATNDYIFVRTKKAIAFADQLNKVEAYRPESSFSDAVKGLHLYGAKVVRPKELVVLKTTYGAETAI